MHKGLVAALLMTALALAGCSGDKPEADLEAVTCPDGAVVTSETLEAHEGHHDAGFDPMSLCPEPPQVTLTGVPASVEVYDDAPFTWAIDPGSVAHGHSMIAEVRYSTVSVPDADASLETYSKPLVKKEHQDLPKTFKGNLTFTTTGKVYVRAYAAVQGDGYDRRDVWGAEIVLDVLPVQPTGTILTIARALNPVESLQGTASGALGDAVAFDNQDLVEHTLTLKSRPAGVAECTLTVAGGQTSATTCLLTAPGSYEFETDDVDPKTFIINVPA